MLPIVYHPDYQAPLRPNHRFPMSKYGYLFEALQRRGLLRSGGYLAPAPFGHAQLALAHSAGYIDRALSLNLSSEEVKRIGLPCTERVMRRSRLSAAGTTLAAWLALEHGVACNAAGGSHHAKRENGAAFCVFNDVAVAACNLLAQGVGAPILIVDTDVHQGDGTAEIFQNDPRVFTLSIHAKGNFPFVKRTSDLDIDLPDGTDGPGFLEHLESALRDVLGQIQPSVAFFNAGVDVHQDDRLGRLALTTEDIRSRDRMVFELLRDHAIPAVGVLGGGYQEDPLCLADLHAILFEEASRVFAM